MKSLSQLQRDFAAELWLQESTGISSAIANDNFSVQKRLNVYRNNISSNLHSALAATYPVTHKLVGAEFFRYLADEYAVVYPSRSGQLRHFGRRLPEFLVDFSPTASLPYLPDIARLEWACDIVSIARSPAQHEPTYYAGLDPVGFSNLRFTAQQASRLVHSNYPIFSIWSANQEAPTETDTVNLDEGAQSVLVIRIGDELELWLLDETETDFADGLVAGQSIGEAVENLAGRGYNIDLPQLVQRYLSSGLLYGPGAVR